jgi:chaperonin cofactor prefoldin
MTTDQLAQRVEQLEHRVSVHERDLSRALRILDLERAGQATITELGELQAIINRYPRHPAPTTDTG